MNKLYCAVALISLALLLSGCQSEQKIQESNRIEAMQMAKWLALGCHLYAQDNDGWLPATIGDLKPYMNEPYDEQAFVMVASGKLQAIEQPDKAVILRSTKALPDGHMAAAYADGHAAIVPMR